MERRNGGIYWRLVRFSFFLMSMKWMTDFYLSRNLHDLLRLSLQIFYSDVDVNKFFYIIKCQASFHSLFIFRIFCHIPNHVVIFLCILSPKKLYRSICICSQPFFESNYHAPHLKPKISRLWRYFNGIFHFIQSKHQLILNRENTDFTYVIQ